MLGKGLVQKKLLTVIEVAQEFSNLCNVLLQSNSSI